MMHIVNKIKQIFLFLISIVLLSSCATLNRQKMLGGFVGASILGGIGASVGKELSPNRESERLNQMIGATTGGAVGFYLGSQVAESLWESHPDNKLINPPFLPNDAPKDMGQRTVIKVLRPKNIQRIELETELPPFLKGKVKKANVITYELESYEEETEDGRRIFHEPHRAYEYVLE